MNSRIWKSVAAILLAVGLSTVSVAGPASAVTAKKTPIMTTQDTGWGFK